MAYARKYYTSYKRKSGGTTTIDILESDYGGSASELKADVNPLTITMQGDVNNIYTPSIGSGAQIRLLVSPLTLKTLFTSDPQKYIVKVYDGNSGDTLKWQGFIDASVYQEDYSIGGTLLSPITLNCNDGMKILENTWYRNNGIAYTGTSTIGEVINTITDKLGTTFSNVYTSNDITTSDGSGTNLFNYIKVNNENFIDESNVSMSCREVLESIFGGLGLILFFRADSIYIIDPINLHSTSKGKVYTLPSYSESSSSIGGYVDVSGNTLNWYDTNQTFDIIPSVNEVQVLYDPYNVVDISYDFNNRDNWSDTGLWGCSDEYCSNNGIEYNNWIEGHTGQFISVKQDTLDTPICGLYLTNTDTAITWNTNKTLYPDTGLNIQISLESYANTRIGSSNIFSEAEAREINKYNIQFAIRIGDNYYKDEAWEPGATGNFKQLMPVRDWSVSQSQYTSDHSLSKIGDKWGNGIKTFPLYNGLSGGTVQLIIYDYWTSSMIDRPQFATYYNLLLKNIKIEVVDAENGNKIDNAGTMFRGNLSTDVVYKTNPLKIETTNGIGPYGVSRGAYLDTNNFDLEGLYRSGDSTIRNSGKLVLQSFISQYKQPRYKLTGVLDVQDYLLDFNLKLFCDNTYLAGKAFFVYSNTYDDWNEIMSVEMLEITSTRETL